MQHVIASKAHTPNKLTFQQTGLVQGKLSQLDSEMFLMPKCDVEPTKAFTCKSGSEFFERRPNVL